MVAPTGNARYLTTVDHTPPEVTSPLAGGHQSQLNFRHSRVQSNIVESFHTRATSQSALGTTNVGQPSTGPTAAKTRASMPTSKAKKGSSTLTQQQQIQEKIKQLQMREQTSGANSKLAVDGQGGRNMMRVITEINKRIEISNQNQTTKKLSSRAAIHTSSQQASES